MANDLSTAARRNADHPLVSFDLQKSLARLDGISSPAALQDEARRAKVLADYARAIKDRGAEQQVAAYYFWAEWKLGETIAAMPKSRGGRPEKTSPRSGTGFGETSPRSGTGSFDPIKTLKEHGISRNEAMRLQRLVQYPRAKAEQYVADAFGAGQAPRTVGFMRWAEQGGRENAFAADRPTPSSDEWYTPADFLVKVQRVFAPTGGIHLDPCSNPGAPNVPAKRHFTFKEDGLSRQWKGNVFVNPPYSQAEAWVRKAYEEHQAGHTAAVMLLLRFSTDTSWFHDFLAGFPVIFIRGRVRFLGSLENGPEFGSMVIWMSEQPAEGFVAAFGDESAPRGSAFLPYPSPTDRHASSGESKLG